MSNAAASIDNASKSMTDIMALCKRRGFIFQASEIYGGVNGFWDYGPQGAQLKKNLRDAWWQDCVVTPPIGPDGDEVSIVGLDSCIIQNPKVWEASGHVGGFSDPMQTCRQCKKLLRADHVWELLRESEWVQSFADAFEPSDDPDFIRFRSDAAMEWARKKGKKLAPGLALVRNPTVTLSWLVESLGANPDSSMDIATLLRHVATEQQAATGLVTPCPHCGGDLTEPREFNLMFKTYLGATATEDDVAYLRPETAQGIFINYKNVLDSTRVKVPFGIAQTGKAFRNEVTPRNFTFRSREFEQMEIEFFCHPDESRKWYEFWRDWRMNWWESLGLAGVNLQLREHDADELAHYAKTGAGTSDIEYRFPFTAPGFGELEGVADRSNFDLKQHAEHGNTKLEYFDQERNERYLPNVIEPSAGLDRGVLALLCEAYTPDPERPSKIFMRFDPRVAPTKAAVFPLVNKDGMPEVGKKLQTALRRRFGAVEYDPKQSIGKRYARMDEVGCPFCFTIDGETLTDQTVTVRHRDTLAQERIAIDKVEGFLAEKLGVS
ncbi:MAG: glycine--tRNA ligase [Phycisphaeraceae bacterium]|nr:glycine--tRNA ligase [Phycisphaeraceae bacterium]MCB9846961.1 glycine--tRNA ligase [Phycisphaeraceae bacterium]